MTVHLSTRFSQRRRRVIFTTRTQATASRRWKHFRGQVARTGNALFYVGLCCEALRQHKLALSNYEQALEHLGQREPELRKLAPYRAGIVAMERLKDYQTAEKHFNSLAADDFHYKDVSERLRELHSLLPK